VAKITKEIEVALDETDEGGVVLELIMTPRVVIA
jgi:hypothetical protein